MTGVGTFSWIAGALQLFVPSYAFRLVRRFGSSRVGWYLVTAFASLALMHLLAPWRIAPSGMASGLTLDLLYVGGSVLLLIGMGHMETLYSERERTQSLERQLRGESEGRIKAETAGLVSAREGLMQELARRDAAIQALTGSESRFRFLFMENPQPMWILDLRSCRFLAANQAALRQYGFSLEEFLALSGRDLLLPACVPQFLQDIAKPCPGAEARGIWQHCRKDGTLVDMELTALDFDHDGSTARLIVASDVTQRRTREMRLRKAHRMEVISQIAGGIAHHFNTIFSTIETSAAVLLEQPPELRSGEPLARISAAVNRGAGLSRLLLAAGGRQLMRPDPLDLSGLLRIMNPMLRRLVGDHIEIEYRDGFHLPPVLADRRMIEQVIVNLVLNARDSMPAGGALKFALTKVIMDDAQLEFHPEAKAGEFVCLSVRDSGCGMSPQTRSRLFEPFFSTRDDGNGTGLGLASASGIITQHSGFIEVDSDLAAGTEIRLYLPAMPGAFSVPGASAGAAAILIKGTILLVEPDDRTRALARFVLNRHGYRVIEADSSTTALVLWTGQGATVDLLITGDQLPGGISGRDLAGQLRQTRPGLKVVLTAESQATPAEPLPAQADGIGILPKPFHPDGLVQAVQVLLAEDQSLFHN